MRRETAALPAVSPFSPKCILRGCLWVIPLLAQLSGAWVLAQPAAVVVDRQTTILLEADQPEAVQLAAKDLASDMEKVFGTAPRLVTNMADTGPVSIVLADEATGAPAHHGAAPEAFSITVGPAEWNGQRRTVIRLAGSDVRGTLFAIYEFSQQYLGTDPMYYWTDHSPAHRTSVSLPLPLDRPYPAPVSGIADSSSTMKTC